MTEYVGPASVIELNCVSKFQQFPPFLMSADTADVGRRFTTAVEVSAPEVDGLRPLLESWIQ